MENAKTFLEYLLVHKIRQAKLFVVQTLLEIADFQNYFQRFQISK